MADLRRVRRVVPPAHIAPYLSGSSFDFASLRTEYQRSSRPFPFRSLTLLLFGLVVAVGLGFLLPRFIGVGRAKLISVTQTANLAESHLESGYAEARAKQFDEASVDFREAKQQLDRLASSVRRLGQHNDGLEALPFSGGSILEKQRLLSIGSDAATLGEQLGQLSASFNQLLALPAHPAAGIAWQDQLSALLRNVTEVADSNRADLSAAKVIAERLARNLATIHDRRALEVKRLSDGLSMLDTLSASLPELIGERGERHYLILFQNNAELRPSGGFLGSFAVATFRDGRLDTVAVNTNIYKLDKAFAKTSHIAPPKILADALRIKSLTLRDSNFNIDPPKALDDVAAFYEAESRQTVDGVVAIDTTLVTDLLRLTGPIELPQYQATIDADNFTTTLAHEIEREYFTDPVNVAVNEPKTILRDLLPIFMERSIKAYQNDPGAVSVLIGKALTGRDLYFYFPDQQLERVASFANVSGAIKESNGDYLLINNANLNGKKSSLRVTEEANLVTTLGSNGTLTDQLTITRTHTGNGIWPDGVNNNYLRVAVPRGAQLLSASLEGREMTGQIETTFESDKTIFGLFVNTPPGEHRVVVLTYQLPFRLKQFVTGSLVDRLTARLTDRGNLAYLPLLVQKQPGVLPDHLRWEVQLPAGYGTDQLPIETNLTGDKNLITKIRLP